MLEKYIALFLEWCHSYILATKNSLLITLSVQQVLDCCSKLMEEEYDLLQLNFYIEDNINVLVDWFSQLPTMEKLVPSLGGIALIFNIISNKWKQNRTQPIDFHSINILKDKGNLMFDDEQCFLVKELFGKNKNIFNIKAPIILISTKTTK